VTNRILAKSVLLVLAVLAATVGPAAAQSAVSTADLQRLQDSIYDTSRDVSRLRERDVAAASRLESELDDASDEAIYLKVKLRKNEPIARVEYIALRDRVESIRSRARGETAPPTMPPAVLVPDKSSSRTGRPASPPPDDVPAGTEFDVRLRQPLSSANAQVEDRVEATTIVDLRDGDRVVVPAGSVMRGIVNSVTKATRLERKGSLTLVFDQITVGPSTLPIHATVVQALESEGIKGEAGKIGAGAGVGAIIGAIIGGARGALAGILIGGGGVIAATEGTDVNLPEGTLLRVRLDSGLNLR
jgi:hypothetical protein